MTDNKTEVGTSQISKEKMIRNIIDTIIKYMYISSDTWFPAKSYFIMIGDVTLNDCGFIDRDEAQEFLQETLVPFLEDVKKGDAAWARFYQKHKQEREVNTELDAYDTKTSCPCCHGRKCELLAQTRCIPQSRIYVCSSCGIQFTVDDPPFKALTSETE